MFFEFAVESTRPAVRRRRGPWVLAVAIALLLPLLPAHAQAARSADAPPPGSGLAWGYNSNGQLGNDKTTNASTPLQVTGLTDATLVAAGRLHSLALKADGSVVAWGDDTSGQLGDGDPFTEKHVPVPVVGLTSVVKIAAGDAHSLALKADGTVWAWGRNSEGQLGDGFQDDRSTPVQVIGLGSDVTDRVTEIAAGFQHSLALKADGTIWAWGHNLFGQLGDGNSGVGAQPTPVKVINLSAAGTAIAGGGLHSLAVLQGGSVMAWGYNGTGQLGDGTTMQRPTPVAVGGLISGSQVAAGNVHSLALKTDRSVLAWGDNSVGQLGANTTVTPVLSPIQVYGLTSGVVAIAAGSALTSSHSLAITTGGALMSWGDNSNGQLGDGTTTNRYTPVQVSGLSRAVTAIAVGGSHSLAAQGPAFAPETPGNVLAAPGNASAAVSWTPPPSDGGARLTPYVVTPYGGPGAPMDVDPGPTNSVLMTGLANGVPYTFTVTARNAVGPGPESAPSNSVTPSEIPSDTSAAKAWGSNGSGELGDGTTTNRRTPVQVSGLSSQSKALTGGGIHSLALRVDGSVLAWGDNGSGQLGDGTCNAKSVPTSVSGLAGGVVATAAGANHSLALRADGSVVAWGFNSFGQLGDGSWDSSPCLTGTRRPVSVRGVTNGIAVAAGAEHSLALTADGTVMAWGYNGFGQLGDGTTDSRPSPVMALTNVKKIAAGGNHSLALKDDGTVWAWGYNGYGQLGTGDRNNSLIPVQVSGLGSGLTDRVTDIAAGSDHSLALKADETVWAWGLNDKGQLGNVNLPDAPTPIQMLRVAAGKALAAGSKHSLVLDADGTTVWATGYNEYGQLGDGTTGNTFVPVKVEGITAPVAIAGGGNHTLAIQSRP